MIAVACRAWILRHLRKDTRVPHDFGRLQGAAMAHVKAFGTALHHTLQFAGDRLRVIFARQFETAPTPFSLNLLD